MESYNGEENNNKKNRRWPKIVIIAALFVGCTCAAFFIGNNLATRGYIFGSIPSSASNDLGQVPDISKYSDLFSLRNLIISKYDGKIDDDELLQGAMKGMAEALGDPYTVYMDSKQYTDFIEASNNFYGIGAQLGVKDDRVTIIAPLEGSPAEKAGLRAGDIILQVDDYVVNDTNTEEVVSRVRGKEGEAVVLTIQRGDADPFEVTIVREEIQSESVKGEMIEGNIGYIQITSFSDEEVSDKFTTKLNELKSAGMEKLILDLRGNPGGYLSECVKIASNFIPEGETVTYTIDKYDEKIVSKSIGGDAQGMPLVVLVNEGSASASEVVTEAFKDYKVATVVGTKTFGKGIVQQLIPFEQSNGETCALKITTSKYYSPKGTNIHGVGIEPDVTVELSEEILSQDYSREIDNQFQKALEIIREK